MSGETEKKDDLDENLQKLAERSSSTGEAGKVEDITEQQSRKIF